MKKRNTVEFLSTSAHTFGGADPWRGGLNALLTSTCASQRSGPREWADGMRTGGEDEAVERVKKVITDGQLQRKWHRQARWYIFFLFFVVQQSIFRHTHTHTLISPFFLCGYFQSLLRSPIICFVLYRIPFHLSYLFNLHLLRQSCDWRTLSTNDPISSLFIDFRALSLFSHLPHHLTPSLLPLLFTSFVSHILFSF